MTKTDQMKIVLGSIRAIILVSIVLLILLLVKANAADIELSANLNSLSQFDMWIYGGIGACFAAFALILLRHENNIAKIQGDPEAVPTKLCIANMSLLKSELSHLNERADKLDDVVERLVQREDHSRERHAELMQVLNEFKN